MSPRNEDYPETCTQEYIKFYKNWRYVHGKSYLHNDGQHYEKEIELEDIKMVDDYPDRAEKYLDEKISLRKSTKVNPEVVSDEYEKEYDTHKSRYNMQHRHSIVMTQKKDKDIEKNFNETFQSMDRSSIHVNFKSFDPQILQSRQQSVRNSTK